MDPTKFHPACPYANKICRLDRPELRPFGDAQTVVCHHAEEVAASGRPQIATTP